MNPIHYYIIDPTKNITALADTPVAPADRPAVAARIMEQEPSCEQVGFVSADGAPCLAMAGGEFCGNAAMSAAALYCSRTGIAPGETRRVTLTVSGADRPVPVEVTAEGAASFACAVGMPPPERVAEETFSLGARELTLPVVYFPGIAHIIVPKDRLSEAEAEGTVKDWCRQLGVPGLGVMLFDRAALMLRPLVYIPAADTLFWESSCASGTAAAGVWLARTAGQAADVTLREPGGCLRVQAEGERIRLSGRVDVLSEHTVLMEY